MEKMQLDGPYPWSRGKVECRPTVPRRTVQRLAKLNEMQQFFRDNGHYEVPREGQTRNLATWKDGLLVKWRKMRADDLFAFIAEHDPRFFKYLEGWAQRARMHEQRAGAHMPFDETASRFLDFIERNQRPPMQSKFDDEEAFLAKWLCRLNEQRRPLPDVVRSFAVRLKNLAKSMPRKASPLSEESRIAIDELRSDVWRYIDGTRDGE